MIRSVLKTTPGVLFLAIVALGCGGSSQYLRSDPPLLVDAATLISQAPLAPDENIRAVEIERGESASTHLVRIRDRETPHVHTRYDLTVVLLEGHGTLVLGGQPLSMRTGDVAFVPKGTPHYFVNESSEPTAAIVSFSPAFDGADQQPLP